MDEWTNGLEDRDRLVRDFLSEYCEFVQFYLCLVPVFLIISSSSSFALSWLFSFDVGRLGIT